MTENDAAIDTLNRYWSLFDPNVTPTDQVPSRAATVFADDATWESQRPPTERIVGKDSIAIYMLRIRAAISSGHRDRSELHWINVDGDDAKKVQWDWTVTWPDGFKLEGTDTVDFAPDGLIQRMTIVVKGESGSRLFN